MTSFLKTVVTAIDKRYNYIAQTYHHALPSSSSGEAKKSFPGNTFLATRVPQVVVSLDPTLSHCHLIMAVTILVPWIHTFGQTSMSAQTIVFDC